MSRDRCAYCAVEVPDRDWFGLEIQRPVPESAVKDDIEWRNEIFCNQDHAARWMDTPMEPPEPSTQIAESGWVVGLILVAVGLVLAGLVSVGFLTVGRWFLAMW